MLHLMTLLQVRPHEVSPYEDVCSGKGMNLISLKLLTAFITMLSSGLILTGMPERVRRSTSPGAIRNNKLECIAQTDRIEHRFNVVISVSTLFSYAQPEIDLGFWKNYHSDPFNVKIPYQFEYFVTHTLINLFNKLLTSPVCNKRLMFSFDKLWLFIPLKLPWHQIQFIF